ncbi:RNA polymerase sigma factor SigF [Oscillatoria sp. FACHB-1407]|uniref:RNA polymerase sigma factor SigF n=1 Tax=Oscillatoria sp. FACHB-1407 TaxID=2692847 RepID=UPI001688E7A7|nr:RNA polymerase sigma factor SigF [Oscillatoria sp. FACHB-1407]MBD2463860.1 RNA polymerase sigma factor SigF [Oscillatoria sp. FACHB-1407]
MAIQSSPRSHGIELLIAYHQNPSVEVRNKLVRLNAGLVRKIAYRMSCQSTEAYEDLEQIGYLGLIRAIERFDPNHGCAFSSFAVPYIRGEIMHFLRDRSCSIRVPRRWQDLNRQGQKIREELSKTLGRQPRDHEVAERLEISNAEWQEIRLATQNRSLLSLDATINQQMDSSVTLGDTLPDPHYQTLQLWEEDRQQVQRALSQLEETTRAAIEYVYYGNLSRKEVAEKIGVSPMTVTRRIQRGIHQMIAMLQPQASPTEP